jgi:hypothetical protein
MIITIPITIVTIKDDILTTNSWWISTKGK